MNKNTFVFHHIKKFPLSGIYKTDPKPLNAASAWEEDFIYSMIHLNLKSSIPGFQKALVTHRWPMREPKYKNENIIWHGETVKYMIFEKRFNNFYKLDKQLFISWAGKDIVKKVIRILNSAFKKEFYLCDINLDLDKIHSDISRNVLKNSTIKGGWIKRSDKKPIRIEAAFGDEVTNDSEFRSLANKGDFTNLKVVIPYHMKNIKCSISLTGSVFFLEDYPLQTCLNFIEYLTKNFQTKQRRNK